MGKYGKLLGNVHWAGKTFSPHDSYLLTELPFITVRGGGVEGCRNRPQGLNRGRGEEWKRKQWAQRWESRRVTLGLMFICYVFVRVFNVFNLTPIPIEACKITYFMSTYSKSPAVHKRISLLDMKLMACASWKVSKTVISGFWAPILCVPFCRVSNLIYTLGS